MNSILILQFIFFTSYLLFLNVNAKMDLTNYILTWNQDFTLISNLSVTAWGPAGPSGSTWIAHTPYAGDWCNFEDPHGDYNPFHLSSGGPLIIRAQKVGTGLATGLLSSVDGEGRGFSQRYGYFEMKARLPSGSGVWPAFWMMDVPGLLNASIGRHEVDPLEAYGDAIGTMRSGVHWWDPNPKNGWGIGFASPHCSMTRGSHTYGIDIQSDYITYYYDRQLVWQINNTIPNDKGKYDRPLYIMANLAYGGGGPNNNISYILDHPQDMLIDYIRVWQGQNGSINANDYTDAPAITWWSGGITLISTQMIVISGVTLLFDSTGRITITNNQKVLLYTTDIAPQTCSNNCSAVFQGDGNLVFHLSDGSVYWSSSTYGNNEGMIEFSIDEPYLQIYDENCKVLWSTENKTKSIDRYDNTHLE